MAEHLHETGRPEDSPARREAAPPDVPTTGATRAEAFEETGRAAKAEYRAAWLVDAEASTPRLVTVSFPPKDR
jgi:hypothetical protein